MRTTRGASGNLRCPRLLRSDLVPRFGDVRDSEVGHERLPHLLFRSERSADEADHHRGPASWSTATTATAVHTPHQLLAGVVIGSPRGTSAWRPS